ncbi:MAG: LysR family transcriptional regulator [Alphaproteobacteria bacterium]|nr:LysR family transcriptional regulator [Alphaproteobacteria bacterium]
MNDTLPLNALRSFEAAARTGSFTRAAAELHVTQSAVSHQIKLLEEWIGSPLFERQGNATKLTPHALTLASSLTSIFTEMDTACRRARTGAKSNTLVIAVIPSVATCWLIPRMSEFKALFPGINTRIIYAIHGHQIDFNEVDVAITYAQEKLELRNAITTRFLAGDSAPVCSPAFLELQGELKTPQQIAKAGLLHDTDRRGWTQWFKKASPQKIEFGEGPIFEDFNLLRAATLAGQGISLCPLSIIEDDLQANRLIALSLITVNAESAYYLVEPASRSHAPRPEAEQFRAWLFGTRGHMALEDQDSWQ